MCIFFNIFILGLQHLRSYRDYLLADVYFFSRFLLSFWNSCSGKLKVEKTSSIQSSDRNIYDFFRLWSKPHEPKSLPTHQQLWMTHFPASIRSKNHTMRSNSTSICIMCIQRTQASLDQNYREFHQNYWKFSLIRSKGPKMDLKHLQFLKITTKFPRAVIVNQRFQGL